MASAPFHVEGKTVVMVTRTGKHLTVALCDFLSPEYVCEALSEKWEREDGR